MNDSFDFIIVGGGTAGCILANRLTASGQYRVLMLEAGGEPRSLWIGIPAGFSKLLTNATYNWRFQTEPEEGTRGRVIAVPRGKGLGGPSVINDVPPSPLPRGTAITRPRVPSSGSVCKRQL